MNRRGFLEALLAAPVVAVAAVAATKKPSVLQPAKYVWSSFHDGFFTIHDDQFIEWSGSLDPTDWSWKPDMILCSDEFYRAYKENLRAAEAHKLRIQSLRRLSRSGSPSAQRAAFAKLRLWRG